MVRLGLGLYLELGLGKQFLIPVDPITRNPKPRNETVENWC